MKKMYIYYDPATNEIEAIYSGKPTSKVWPERGYVLTEIPAEMKPDIGKTVVLDGDEVVEVTGERRVPEPPEKTEKQKEIEKLQGKKISDLTPEEKDFLLDVMLEGMLNPKLPGE